MNILIAYAALPFEKNKYELIARKLKSFLIKNDISVQIVRMIYDNDPNDLQTCLAYSLLKIDFVDKLITLNLPSHYLSHRNHIIWALGQHTYFNKKLFKFEPNILNGENEIPESALVWDKLAMKILKI